jgi:carboxyl-terminal processing protease
MEEAIKLAGMFVDAGPISILVDNKNKQNVLKDSNRGSVYNGPIVILINGNSASASEFFAAAMQDYNRAIIVGSTSLGKASMQNIMPLDENNSEDFVKLTIRKFYRVTGESHQIKGIVPDISIPALFDKQIPRETSYKRALKYDSIITKYRFTPLTNNFSNLSELSYIRTKKNARFNEIIGLNKEIDVIYNSQKKPIRITLNDLFKEIHEIDPLWKKVKKLITIESSCKISNNSFDLEKMQYDDFLKESNIFKIKELKVNSYIDESIAILNDHIILNK